MSNNKYIRLILAVVMSVITAKGLSSLAQGSTTLEAPLFDVYPSAGLVITVVGAIFLLPLIYIFLKISYWGTIVVFVLLLLSSFFLFKSFDISGVEIGPYKENRLVYGVAKPLIFFRPISTGDVVVYKRASVAGGRVVASVIGESGDLTNGAAHISNVSIGEVIPAGSYLVEFGEEKKQIVIPESQITYLIWYPLKW